MDKGHRLNYLEGEKPLEQSDVRQRDGETLKGVRRQTDTDMDSK